MYVETLAVSRENIFIMFKIDENKRIVSKGRFEGEFLYAPYFYDLMLEGCSITNCTPQDEEVHESIDCFVLDEKDVREFPELEENGYKVGDTIIFQQNDVGFYLELRKVRVTP